MSIDQFPISTREYPSYKSICGKGRSCIIDSGFLHKLIDRTSATMPGTRSRPAYFEDCKGTFCAARASRHSERQLSGRRFTIHDSRFTIHDSRRLPTLAIESPMSG
jgi:hypothetical protein